MKYRLSERRISFGSGISASIDVDWSNSQFSDIVRLLDRHRPHVVSIRCSVPVKSHLLLVRALFHSALTDFELRMVHGPGHLPFEDFIVPLCKTFGSEMTGMGHKTEKGVMISRYRIRRNLPSHPHPIGFYVMTNGKDIAKLDATLKTIADQSIPNADIAVVGPAALREHPLIQEKYSGTRVIPDEGIYSSDKRMPLSRKKNLVFNEIRAERLVILHDRIRLGPGFAKRLLETSPWFDLYTCRLTASGTHRYLDKFGVRFDSYYNLRKRHYYLDYREDNIDQQIDGGFFVLHARALQGDRFDDRLHWGEMEDLDFVLRRKLEFNLVTFDPGNQVESLFTNHFSLKEGSPLRTYYKSRVRRWKLGYWIVRGIARARVWKTRRLGTTLQSGRPRT